MARESYGWGVNGLRLTALVSVSAGHALLKGAGGVLLNQDGEEISYVAEAEMKTVSHRCFGGSPSICRSLVNREWARLFK
jgi:myo-inositol-1(or 4)-monophosphatase